jgi:glycosyltransferase involved in cell wall biosynthesis
MPCRNGAPFISAAIASVQRQNYPNLEHIVLDARSTDGTLSLLQSYPDVVVVSEPDGSAHEAMNKGLSRASGDVIGFLAVDDLYPDGALMDVGRLFAAQPDVDVVVGHTLVFEEDEKSGRRLLFEYTHPRGLWLPELMFGVSGFYGIFFRRRVFDLTGRFDESFDFTADVHYLIRVILAGLKAARVDRPTILYRMHAGSRTINPGRTNRLAILRERFRMGLDLAATSPAGPQVPRLLLAWHALEGAKLVALALMRGEVAEAARILVALSRDNPLWPLRLLHGLALRHLVKTLEPTGRPPAARPV